MRFRTFGVAAAAAAALCAGMANRPASAQGAGDAYIGQLMVVGFSYCPSGWADAAGQSMPINQNQALYSLFGTTFGGDGVQTFNLPDLRGRLPIGQGSGPGLPPIVTGQSSGSASVTLTTPQMPMHTHIATTTLNGTENEANSPNPAGALLASGVNVYATGAQANASLSSASVNTTLSVAGGSQPVGVMNPYLGLRWCVSLQGIYPSRP